MAKLTVITDLVVDAKHDRCKLDVFRPAGSKPAPLVVLVHGGGWRGGHRCQYHQTCIELANSGFAAASVGYRLMPEAVWPEIAHDVVRGAAYLAEHADELGIDASRAVSWGSSAGGHLALALAAKASQWVADGIVKKTPEFVGTLAQCPATSLATPDSASTGRATLMNGHPQEEVSPAHMPEKLFKSVLVIHGDADTVIPLDKARAFVDRLDAAGVDAKLEVLPGVGHGYGYNLFNKGARESLALSLPYLRKCLMP